MPEDGGRVQYLPKTHRDVSWANRGDELAGEWSDAWGTDMVVPPMDAGTAAIYSYTTMHRGLASSIVAQLQRMRNNHLTMMGVTMKPHDNRLRSECAAGQQACWGQSQPTTARCC